MTENSDEALDRHYMQLALDQADLAQAVGEVPVGAVVIRDGRVLGVGHNAPIRENDPTAHAEVQALRAAAKAIGNYRLEGCSLYVTLEPCAMCAGAILHSRIKRLVYGAADPKAGVAGSLLNLFDVAALNHHTQVNAGVLAEQCSRVVSGFFSRRRAQHSTDAKAKMPLREDALRTPESAFFHLQDFHWAARYVSHLPSLNGLRQHVVDTGPPNARQTLVCLHEIGYWAYAFKEVIPEAIAQGYRVIVPDQIGFGKSDKPKKYGFYTLDWHRQNLHELVHELVPDQADTAVTWMLQGAKPWGFSPEQLLPKNGGTVMMQPEKFANFYHPVAWSCPFPDAGYKAGLRAFTPH